MLLCNREVLHRVLKSVIDSEPTGEKVSKYAQWIADEPDFEYLVREEVDRLVR